MNVTFSIFWPLLLSLSLGPHGALGRVDDPPGAPPPCQQIVGGSVSAFTESETSFFVLERLLTEPYLRFETRLRVQMRDGSVYHGRFEGLNVLNRPEPSFLAVLTDEGLLRQFPLRQIRGLRLASVEFVSLDPKAFDELIEEAWTEERPLAILRKNHFSHFDHWHRVHDMGRALSRKKVPVWFRHADPESGKIWGKRDTFLRLYRIQAVTFYRDPTRVYVLDAPRRIEQALRGLTDSLYRFWNEEGSDEAF